jgi:RNA polymerase sigma-70 factor (ECF subfamily)
VTLIAPAPPHIDRDNLLDRTERSTIDRQIRERLIAREDAALADAYRQHRDRVYRVALGILRRADLAEDVTQRVFVRLWQRPERFDPSRGTLGGFLQLDAHGRAVDLLRSERARVERELREHRLAPSSDGQVGIEEEVMRRISSERVRDALSALTDDQRTSIMLAFFEGHSYRKVAELLGQPEGTVKSRIRIGLARLKELLGEATPGLA